MKHTVGNIPAIIRRRQKKILLLFAAVCCAVATRATVYSSQVSAGTDEVIKSVIVDGNNLIHVGYEVLTANIQSGVIFKSTTGGTITWYTQVTTPTGPTGSKTVLNKVIKGANGNYYAAGWSTPGLGAGAGTVEGLVCEIDAASGNLVHWATWHNNDEVRYMDLCELPNGAIAAVGWINSGISKALLTLFTPTLLTSSSTVYLLTPAQGTKFTAVTHDGNTVIAGGNMPNITLSDGILTYIDATNPSMPGFTFTHDYHPTTTKLGIGTLMKGMLFNKLFFDNVNNQVIANTSLFDPSNMSAAEDGAIMEISNTTYQVTNGLRYGDPASLASNSAKDGLSIISSTPGSTDYMVILSPGGNTFNSGTMPLPVPPPYNNVVARLTSNAVAVSKISAQGHALFSSAPDVASGMLYSSGYVNNGTVTGNYDILEQYTNFNMTDNVPPCLSDYPIAVAPLQVPVTSVNLSKVSPPLIQGADPGTDKPTTTNKAVCGTLTPGDSCSLQCYWRVTGNNITMPNNIFGTLNGASIDIRTNNLSRAVVDGTTGYVGIKQLLPSTTLEVDCSATTAPSGLRLINLPQHEGNALVVDPATGDVFMAQSTIYKPAGDTKELEDQISELQQQLNNLTNRISGNTHAADGGNMLSISPNPTEGKATATYSISGTFSKAAIRIMDNAGRIIQEILLTNGNGSVKIILPGGTASNQVMCTLMVDGKIAATQKVMLLNK